MLPPTPNQARIIWAALTGAAVALLVALIAALIWGLGRVLDILSPVLWPLAVAGVIGYLLDPVVDWLQRKGLSRSNAILVVFGVALLIVAGLLASVIPQVVRQTRDLVSRIPEYTRRLELQAEHLMNNPPGIVQKLLKWETKPGASSALPPNTNQMPVISTNELSTPETSEIVLLDTNTSVVISTAPSSAGTNAVTLTISDRLDQQTIQSATGWVAKALPAIGSWVFGQVTHVASWIGMLVGLALVPIYAFYLLLEKRGIESKWTNYLPVSDSSFKDEIVFILRSINGYLVAFFRGQVLVAICDAILYTIGFLIIGIPYAVLLGVMAVFLTLIPFLGAIALCVMALILALVQYGDWQHPLGVLAVFAVVQTLEGFVISPKIMGDRVGLHPLTIIIAVMVGTTLLGGLLGGILAIPLTAVLRVLMARYIWKLKKVG
jgi:predicted PurR-regulated permease PerM